MAAGLYLPSRLVGLGQWEVRRSSGSPSTDSGHFPPGGLSSGPWSGPGSTNQATSFRAAAASWALAGSPGPRRSRAAPPVGPVCRVQAAAQEESQQVPLWPRALATCEGATPTSGLQLTTWGPLIAPPASAVTCTGEAHTSALAAEASTLRSVGSYRCLLSAEGADW